MKTLSPHCLKCTHRHLCLSNLFNADVRSNAYAICNCLKSAWKALYVRAVLVFILFYHYKMQLGACYLLSMQQNFNNTDDISLFPNCPSPLARPPNHNRPIIWTKQSRKVNPGPATCAHHFSLLSLFASWARSSYRIIWKSSEAVRRILILHSSPAALLVKRILSPEMDRVSINNSAGQHNVLSRNSTLPIYSIDSTIIICACLCSTPFNYFYEGLVMLFKGPCYLLPPRTNWLFPNRALLFRQ